MDLRKIEHRAIIKFLTSEKISVSEIHQRLVKYSGTDAPSFPTVSRWVLLFQRGRSSLEDDERPGRPISTSYEENILKIQQIVRTDRRLKLREIAKDMDISKSSVYKILTENLGMRKISARWVPKLLTLSEKQIRVQFCQENLDFIADEPDFISTLVTGDETWCYYYDPETKEQSKQWKTKRSPVQVKAKREKSAGKVMATVFWDCEGVLLLEFMPKKSTITGLSYVQTIKNLNAAIQEKRGRQARKKKRILHDNAPSHTARISTQALLQCKFEQMFHPPYSPDLAPSDYYLFRNLKNHLKGKRYQDDNEVKEAVQSYFDNLPQSHFLTGLESLISKWQRCIELQGDYIEKQ
jgi:histone-lysine N-methyltransferase SETMAR